LKRKVSRPISGIHDIRHLHCTYARTSDENAYCTESNGVRAAE
jgi:hypothetical protein